MVVVLAVELAIQNREYVPQLLELRAPIDSSALDQRTVHIHGMNARDAHPSPNLNMFTLQPSESAYEPASLGRTWRLMSPSTGDDYGRVLSGAAIWRRNPLGTDLLDRPLWLARTYVRGEVPRERLFSPGWVVYLDSGTPSRVPETPGHAVDSLVAAMPVERIPVSPISGDVDEFRGRLPQTRARSLLSVSYSATVAGELISEFDVPGDGGVRSGLSCRFVPTYGEVDTLELPVPDVARDEFRLTARMDSDVGQLRVVSVELVADAEDESDLIEIVDWRPNSLEVVVHDLPDDRLLVFTDASYPGWIAEVNGESVPIFSAYGAFKAVEVPAGTHRVRFEFRSRSIRNGAIVSGLTWMASVVVLVTILILRARSRTSAGRSRRSD